MTSAAFAAGHESLVDAAKLPTIWGPGTAWSLLEPANAFSLPPPSSSSPCHSRHALPSSLFPCFSQSCPFPWATAVFSLPAPSPQSSSHWQIHTNCGSYHWHTHTNCGSYHNSTQPPPHSASQREVLLACPDPHLDIALSMLTAKSWRHSCHS